MCSGVSVLIYSVSEPAEIEIQHDVFNVSRPTIISRWLQQAIKPRYHADITNAIQQQQQQSDSQQKQLSDY